MELILTRVCKNKDYTEGRIEIDGTPFCDTLEPTCLLYTSPSPRDRG